MALVYGVGIREDGKYSSVEDGKHSKLYTLWKNMLARCYSTTMLARRPTYELCEVQGDFLYFQKFAAWYESQILDPNVDYQLDKDLINKGNKVYSAETCLLVPRKINMFLCKSEASRGQYPIGVSFHRKYGKFVAQVADSMASRGDKRVGFFDTVEETFEFYKKAKEQIAVELANKYKDVCDPRVVKALIDYRVHIDD